MLSFNTSLKSAFDLSYNFNVKDMEKRKLLCGPKGEGGGCEKSDGSIWPPTILFLANFVAGIGGSLYYTLGVSYMDDNIQKAKTPALISKCRTQSGNLVIFPLIAEECS
jgi:hypothetical protein